MSETVQKAFDVLLEIADNEDLDPDARTRAACAILDRVQQVPTEQPTTA